MFVFGFPLGLINICLMWRYYTWASEKWPGTAGSTLYHNVFILFQLFIMGPVAIALAISPFFGGWIYVAIARHVRIGGVFRLSIS